MASSKINWEVYDKVEQAHSPDWYWAVSIIALSITITSVILENTLFAVLVVVSTIALFLRKMQLPRLVRYELTNRGLWTNKEFQAFQTFESFWVEDGEIASKLILKSKNFFTPLLIIPLEEGQEDEIRDFLQEFLVEVEHQEPLAKRIMEFLGF